mmetsp:Transcript_19734/g.62777  ORF Transcript_19734/g.62777 Transcript_19734/m.62777 type:complete len:345 (-) Transcript_19734:516-1550(-)
MRRAGVSMAEVNSFMNLPATSPSHTRWSAEMVTVILVTVSSCPPAPITACFTPVPTAMIAAWGGLMMALNSVTPNIPRLEMLKVPPWYSSGVSRFSRALLASSLTSAEICWRDLDPASRTMGVISPPSVATAMAMSTCGLAVVPADAASHIAFASGTLVSATAHARTTKSFTDTLTPCSLRVERRTLMPSRRASALTYMCGMVVLDSRRRLAMIFLTLLLGTSVNFALGPPAAAWAAAAGGAWAAAAAAAGAWVWAAPAPGFTPAATAASTSPFVMIPLGPVAVICVWDSPVSRRSIRAAGPIIISSGTSTWAAAGAGAAAGAADGVGAGAPPGAASAAGASAT